MAGIVNKVCYEPVRGREITTAVKRLNRYFSFLLLGFHLPVTWFFENRATKKCQSLTLIVNLMALVT